MCAPAGKKKVNVSHCEIEALVLPLSSKSKETHSCPRCSEIKCLNLSYHSRMHACIRSHSRNPQQPTRICIEFAKQQDIKF